MKKLLTIALLLVPLCSFSQLSVSPEATVTGYGNLKPLYGFGLKAALDFGAHSQVSVTKVWESAYEWAPLGSEVVDIDWKVPKRIKSPAQSYGEWNASYTYFFEGDNVTFNSLYASVGPTLFMRSMGMPSKVDPNAEIMHSTMEYLLDIKIGAAAHIGLGWLFLEGRIAPRIYQQQLNGGLEPLKGPLYGLNTGIRFLINRHPRCGV
jgi:hypothetical protein